MINAILFVTSVTAFQSPSGGEIQMLKYKTHLERTGLNIQLFNPLNNRIDEFDVIHLFTLSPSVYEFIKYVKKAYPRKKLVLSPIYWPSDEFVLKSKDTFQLFSRKFLYFLREISNFRMVDKTLDTIDIQYSSFKNVDLILPNSFTEARIIAELFGIPQTKIKVLHNGVDESFSKANPLLFESIYGLRDFILYVGRIEPRKNVLSLIYALKELDMPSVIIGSSNPIYSDYYELCRKSAGKNVTFISTLPHESEMLQSAYSASKVFVLPSWFETPGLAALEAASAGCNIVITDRGSTKEYFKDMVYYVNPSLVSDIREKILLAYSTPRSNRLKKYISENYSWKKTSERLYDFYRALLN